MAKRYTEVAVKKLARTHDEHGETTSSIVDLASGDTAWNPHGADIADAARVVYHFHTNGDPAGVMVMPEVPPFM